MAILDLNKTAEHITSWIRDYAKKAGVKTLVLGLSGGIDSALVALLCRRTGMPLVCVNMPCRSSSSAFERADAFAKEQGLSLFKVDLTEAHGLITKQFNDQVTVVNAPVYLDMNSVGSTGGLSSCLRAPTLSFLAHSTNGLIMGTGNRSEDHILRYFQKGGDGVVDISPIADLFKSEVRELFEFLATDNYGIMLPGAAAIYDAVPSADLLGPEMNHTDEDELQMSYQEIEYGDRLDMVTGVIFNDQDPSKTETWQGLTARQRVVVAKMHSMEKISRHKENPSLPVCKVRNVEGLVR